MALLVAGYQFLHRRRPLILNGSPCVLNRQIEGVGHARLKSCSNICTQPQIRASIVRHNDLYVVQIHMYCLQLLFDPRLHMYCTSGLRFFVHRNQPIFRLSVLIWLRPEQQSHVLLPSIRFGPTIYDNSEVKRINTRHNLTNLSAR